MLDFTRASSYEPGTNLRGEQADTTWLFILPSLEVERVLCIGSPSAGTLATLTPLAGRVSSEVADEATPDLVFVAARGAREATGAELAERLERTLAAGGAVYLEPSSGARRLASRLGARSHVVLGTPSAGAAPAPEVRAPVAWAVPTTRAMPQGAAAQIARASRVLRRARGRLPFAAGGPEDEGGLIGVTGVGQGALPAGGSGPRPGLLLRGDAEPPQRLPAYIRALARDSGHDLDHHVWALAPPRGYPSQKVIFFARDGGGGVGDQVIKSTQQSRFNDRLENEYHALVALEERGLSHAAALPRPMFLGQHAGLAVVGQTTIDGDPFRARSSAEPGCRWAMETIAALTRLGVGSAAKAAPVPAAEVAAILTDLLGRYTEIHDPPAAHRRFLSDRIDALGRSPDPLPSVFMHGDPTSLNLIVTPDDEVGFVDWENAEPDGMPLWDLYYFVQVYAAWSAARNGMRYTPEVFRRQLLEPSDFRELLQDAVSAYRSSLGLSEEAADALFHTCWMYRALRESRQHPRESVGRGLYTRILHAGIEAAA